MTESRTRLVREVGIDDGELESGLVKPTTTDSPERGDPQDKSSPIKSIEPLKIKAQIQPKKVNESPLKQLKNGQSNLATSSKSSLNKEKLISTTLTKEALHQNINNQLPATPKLTNPEPKKT